jgi:hypothetical protein
MRVGRSLAHRLRRQRLSDMGQRSLDCARRASPGQQRGPREAVQDSGDCGVSRGDELRRREGGCRGDGEERHCRL